ncbi:DNA repair protein RecO [bacterium]|nr:DNA repair protein RecO [bacterium]
MRTTSLIVRVFCDDGTIVPLLFKGALSSRKGDSTSAYLLPFALLEFLYYEKETRQVQTASTVSIIEDFPAIRIDYETQLLGAKFLKRAISVIKPGESYPEIFGIILALLRYWEKSQKTPDDIIWTGFLLKILTFAGFAPAIERCAICQRQLGNKNIKFSPSAGGLICNRCPSPDDAILVGENIPKFLQYMLGNSFPQYEKLNITQKSSKQSKELMEKFWIYHIA